jgi:hypothetical protein
MVIISGAAASLTVSDGAALPAGSAGFVHPANSRAHTRTRIRMVTTLFFIFFLHTFFYFLIFKNKKAFFRRHEERAKSRTFFLPKKIKTAVPKGRFPGSASRLAGAFPADRQWHVYPFARPYGSGGCSGIKPLSLLLFKKSTCRTIYFYKGIIHKKLSNG